MTPGVGCIRDATRPRPGRRARVGSGLTLLELLIGLTIGALLMLLAGPGYRRWIADAEVRDRVEALVNGMGMARAEAIKRGLRVNLCQSDDGAHCTDSGRWEAGWLVYADENHNGDLDPDETVIRTQGPARPGITARGNKPVAKYVSYTSLGQTRMQNGALQMGTFTICRSGHNIVEVVLANGGRVRVDRTKVPCP